MILRKQLVTAHLEGISWRIFNQYPEAVRDLIKGRFGVYALYKRDRLYYVGLASNLVSRLKSHLRDRHDGAWDRFNVYFTIDKNHMRELESLLVRIARPAGNKQRGKFASSSNLKIELKQKTKSLDDERREVVLGKKQKRKPPGRIRKKRKDTTTEQGADLLSALISNRTKLKGRYKGKNYIATLRKNGKIQYGGILYDSPSSAASAVTNYAMNGWKFWTYRDSNNGWVPLNRLKR